MLSDPEHQRSGCLAGAIAGKPIFPNSSSRADDHRPVAPAQIIFSTVADRTYRLESTFSLDTPWAVLRDGISGTGGNVMFTDLRNLSGVSAVFYRVAVY